MLLCGLKLSYVGLILSVWGFIQLGLTGIFFKCHAVALLEDVVVEKQDLIDPVALEQALDVGYSQNALNCWVAALLYLLTFCISAQQYWMHKRIEEVKSEQFY